MILMNFSFIVLQNKYYDSSLTQSNIYPSEFVLDNFFSYCLFLKGGREDGNFDYHLLFIKKSHDEHISPRETLHITAANGVGSTSPSLLTIIS